VNFALKLANKSDETDTQPAPKEPFALDSDSEEDVNFTGNFKMAYVYEKIAAICALGHFAQASPKTYG
jgi:hypothetical protein